MIHYPVIPIYTPLGYNLREVIDMALLESRNERVKLLKKGITGTQIETLYVILNSLDVVSVNWHDDEIPDQSCNQKH